MVELNAVLFSGIECGGFCAAMNLRERGVTGWVILAAALGVAIMVHGWSREDLTYIHLGLMGIGISLVQGLEARLMQKIDVLHKRLDRLSSQLHLARTPAGRVSAGSRDLSDMYSNGTTARR